MQVWWLRKQSVVECILLKLEAVSKQLQALHRELWWEAP
jgi:hypothetical protein